MIPMHYWPPADEDHIGACIKIEAEDLTDTTLLAVHEPMTLTRVGGGPDLVCPEQALLEHFLKVDRPIPIIGKSGVGKSHLIRWLEAQLRMREDSGDWHIVRVPKNASLRQVLTLLLDGLEGEVFAQARNRISEVGETLSTEKLAELLIVFVSDQLNQIYQAVRENPEPPARETEEGQRAQDILVHAFPGALGELIRDPVYAREMLLGPGQCFHQLAMRMTQGATDEQIACRAYEMEPEDLDIRTRLEISDLSLNARRYVQTARLTSSAPARQAAARVLNEVLDDSTREAFQRFFQFNTGSFQDLFKDIRRALKGRTLVVLVEDMAAISAIQDVLIDSLVEERGTGSEELCLLRSAIAVTDGHAGYRRRRATIATRAHFEFFIKEAIQEDEDQTFRRIENFCSRYLNAARHGARRLEELWKDRALGAWPPVWEDPDAASDHLDAFGRGQDTGIPLFPFNGKAIRALVKGTSDQDNEQVVFNPRKILSHILLPVLRDQRQDCVEGAFPVPQRFSVRCPPRLLDQLRQLGLSSIRDRVVELAAIWGYGCKDLEELRERMSPEVPMAFGLEAFCPHLKRTGPPAPTPNPPPPEELAKKEAEHESSEAALDPHAIALHAIEEAVSSWLSKKVLLPQDHSKNLRSALANLYTRHAMAEKVTMRGVPVVAERNRPRVALFLSATANPTDSVPFFQIEDLDDNDKRTWLQSTAIALLRYAYFNARPQPSGWNYPLGLDDYATVQNFAERWVPSALGIAAKRDLQELPGRLRRQVAHAWMLGLFRDSDTHVDRLNKLLQPGSEIQETFASRRPLSPVLGGKRLEALGGWEQSRGEWLKLVSFNAHGLDSDRVLEELPALLREIPKDVLAALDKARREIPDAGIRSVRGLLGACENARGLETLLRDMADLAGELIASGKCVEPGTMGSSEVRTILHRLAGSPLWQDLTAVLEAQDPAVEAKKAWASLVQLDAGNLVEVFQVLEAWDQMVQGTYARLERENRENQSGQILEYREKVEKVIDDLDRCVQEILEGAH